VSALIKSRAPWAPKCQSGLSPQLQCLRLIAAPIWPAAGCSQMPAASLVARRFNFDQADQYSSCDEGREQLLAEKPHVAPKTPSEAGISQFDWRSPRHSIKYRTRRLLRPPGTGPPERGVRQQEKKMKWQLRESWRRQQEKGSGRGQDWAASG